MHEGPGERDLQLLAARISLAPPVRKIAHPQAIHEFVDPPLEGLTDEPMQSTVIQDMLTPGQPWIEAAHIGQNTESALRLEPFGPAIKAINRRMPHIRLQEPRYNPKCGGLAGSVVADQAQNLTVLGFERQVVDGMNISEGFMKIFDFDHAGLLYPATTYLNSTPAY